MYTVNFIPYLIVSFSFPLLVEAWFKTVFQFIPVLHIKTWIRDALKHLALSTTVYLGAKRIGPHLIQFLLLLAQYGTWLSVLLQKKDMFLFLDQHITAPLNQQRIFSTVSGGIRVGGYIITGFVFRYLMHLLTKDVTSESSDGYQKWSARNCFDVSKS